MGLYLAVFSGDEELDGVEIGHYEDFGEFRDAVVRHLEPRGPGTRFPTLILHSDCDGEWTPAESARLEKELSEIGDEFLRLPPVAISKAWKVRVAKLLWTAPKNLYDCYFDVDGEPLIERLISLARLSHEHREPILFQ